MLSLHTDELTARAQDLRAGERVSLSGTVYTARDAAHKRLAAIIEAGEALPFPLEGACIYYAGPTPTRPGQAVGSCGPTTSGRMDPFTPLLLAHGLRAMIGKGERDEATCRAIVERGALYFCAIGGAGALAARCVRSCEEVAFPDLGCESVKRMEIVDFPLILGVDARGGNAFRR
ncbi:MAG: FumA C-terminus/TtdB family hydratase beta subunit [Oscillospiraceae bacterium]|nr:FumA C-terminus/TtdB family hydratase beta subunit [Oscillospiraceae bacterium]